MTPNGAKGPQGDEIAKKYASIADAETVLGKPVDAPKEEVPGIVVGRFEFGAIVARGEGEPSVVHGAIYTKWVESGVLESVGWPTTDETGANDGLGRFNRFDQGSIYFTPETGAHAVHGAIHAKWAAPGYEAGTGYPLTDESPLSDGKGRYTDFQKGSIYWGIATGARLLYGTVRDTWRAMGDSSGPMAIPSGTPGSIKRT